MAENKKKLSCHGINDPREHALYVVHGVTKNRVSLYTPWYTNEMACKDIELAQKGKLPFRFHQIEDEMKLKKRGKKGYMDAREYYYTNIHRIQNTKAREEMMRKMRTEQEALQKIRNNWEQRYPYPTRTAKKNTRDENTNFLHHVLPRSSSGATRSSSNTPRSSTSRSSMSNTPRSSLREFINTIPSPKLVLTERQRRIIDSIWEERVLPLIQKGLYTQVPVKGSLNVAVPPSSHPYGYGYGHHAVAYPPPSGPAYFGQQHPIPQTPGPGQGFYVPQTPGPGQGFYVPQTPTLNARPGVTSQKDVADAVFAPSKNDFEKYEKEYFEEPTNNNKEDYKEAIKAFKNLYDRKIKGLYDFYNETELKKGETEEVRSRRFKDMFESLTKCIKYIKNDKIDDIEKMKNDYFLKFKHPKLILIYTSYVQHNSPLTPEKKFKLALAFCFVVKESLAINNKQNYGTPALQKRQEYLRKTKTYANMSPEIIESKIAALKRDPATTKNAGKRLQLDELDMLLLSRKP
jgi:hypothetical protein